MMEILRFDSSGSTSTNGKKSSKGMLAIGLIATLFGIGSAFASSTIVINDDAAIALGQGVTAVTACDTTISIVPQTAMRVGVEGPKFYVDTITVSNVDTSTTSTTEPTKGQGCQDKFFDLQVFKTAEDDSVSAYSCAAMGYPVMDPAFTCDSLSNTISFEITALATSYAVPFNNFESDFSYVTLVSRNPR
jgi:hypothetical protein